LLAQKKRTKEKGSLKSFFCLAFYRLPMHYNSFALLTQTVMLTLSLRFASSKMLIYFQKRFDGIYRLTAIWVRISINKKIRIKIWVSNGLREFWEIASVMRLAARALSKQYCLSEQRERVVLRAQAEKHTPQNSLQP
jgi:hypothetical protein